MTPWSTTDLRRYRYHTGATLRPLRPEEACPVLFRDVGLDGMALYLSGRLTRLAGPLSPITYLRSAAHREPYTDHGRIGRLVFLRPRLLAPWHSGNAHIYVADARATCDPDSFGFVPGGQPDAEIEARVAGAGDSAALREALGGRVYDEQALETRERIARLSAGLAASEALAEPLRRCLQGPDRELRDRARRAMEAAGVSEHDLCAAWHHLADDRRAALVGALDQVDPALLEAGRGLSWRLRL